MKLAERIRRLEDELVKRGGCMVDPLRWQLDQYRTVIDALPMADREAWESWVRSGMEGEPPEAGALSMLVAICRLETDFPGLLAELPIDWRNSQVLRHVLDSQPPRRRIPDPTAADPEAEERAQMIIDRLAAELTTERSADALSSPTH